MTMTACLAVVAQYNGAFATNGQTDGIAVPISRCEFMSYCRRYDCDYDTIPDERQNEQKSIELMGIWW